MFYYEPDHETSVIRGGEGGPAREAFAPPLAVGTSQIPLGEGTGPPKPATTAA